MERSHTHILVVDDDLATVETLRRALKIEGYQASGTTSVEEALEWIGQTAYDLLVTDLVMPNMDGLALLEEVRKRKPTMPVVICTGFGTIPSAVEAIRRGAADYLTKPVNLEQLNLVLERTLRTYRLEEENRHLKMELKRREGVEGIVGQSARMAEVFKKIHSVAPTDATVLIRGESGTGKELVARAIHQLSLRADNPLVTVNCAAFTETLIESELFGHEKGAFTGAYKQTKGRVEAADGGTIFLDEIGDLSPSAQSKLLRLLQERTFERVGSNVSRTADVRVLGATHRNLEQLIEEGIFREDLYYRVNVIQITLPALRERRDDIPLLFRTFFNSCKAKYGKPNLVADPEVLSGLERHHWPGNIRELKNLTESLVIMASEDRLRLEDLPERIRGSAADAPTDGPSLLDGTHALEEIEREAIHLTLLRTRGNKSEAAKILGIGLKTLYRRLNEEMATQMEEPMG